MVLVHCGIDRNVLNESICIFNVLKMDSENVENVVHLSGDDDTDNERISHPKFIKPKSFILY